MASTAPAYSWRINRILDGRVGVRAQRQRDELTMNDA